MSNIDSVSTILSLKDFLPLIGTITTVIIGYKLISVQARKNRRSKWIDDFRTEAAKFVATTTNITKRERIDNTWEVLVSVSTLMLYLNEVDSKSTLKIQDELVVIQKLFVENHNKVNSERFVKMVSKQLSVIMELVSKVIFEEKRKI